MKNRILLRSGLVGVLSASWIGVQLWVAVKPAQSQPGTSPTTALSTQERQELERLRDSQRAQSAIQQELDIRKTVQDEVDRAFNRSTTLLNLMLTILTILPIIATVLLYLSRQRAMQELRQQMEKQIQKEVNQQLETQVKAELDKYLQERVMTELEQQSLIIQKQMVELQQHSLSAKEHMQQQTDEFQEEIAQLQTKFETQLEKLKNTETEYELELTRVLQKTSSITLVAKAQDVLSPENKHHIQTLTKQLDEIESKSSGLTLNILELIRKGDALFFAERYEEAIGSYTQAIDKAMISVSDVFAAWHGKARALRRLKQYSQALEANTKALALKPTDPFALFERGYLLQLQEHYAEALDAYDKAIEAKPNQYRAHNHRGYVLLKLQRYDEGLAELNKGIELKPTYGSGYYGKAYYYLLHNQVDVALDNLKTAIDLYSKKYKTLAKTDPDFASLRESDRFQTIVGSA